MKSPTRTLAALSLFAAASAAAAPQGAPDKPLIAVELKAATPVVTKGEFPKLVAEVVNKSDKEITLVKPGDGSESGMRTPLVKWEIEGVKPGPRPRCGNINALKADEVVTLKPGQRLPLGDWLGPLRLPGAGKYKVQLRYENNPALKWGGIPLGNHDEAAMARVRASTPAVAVSNAVEVEVRE
jgi:hypothetical protein